MIKLCTKTDFETIYTIINDAAQAYKGEIPVDCYHQPYMPKKELQDAIDEGVIFWGYEDNGEFVGVMGIQDVQDVTLIRHAYVCTTYRNKGIGGKLLMHLLKLATKPVLIGTWASATWAIKFYQKYGFEVVSSEQAVQLLKKYWKINQRQIETSVVLAQRG